MRPYIRAVTGFLVLAVLVLPMKDTLLGLGAFFKTVKLEGFLGGGIEEEYESVFEDAIAEASKEEAEKALARQLESAFGLKEGTCAVRLTLDGGKICRVLILLSGRSVLQDPRPLEAYVKERFSCPCDVAVG